MLVDTLDARSLSLSHLRQSWVRMVRMEVTYLYPESPSDSLKKDRKSTRLNSSHRCISYAVFCLKKKNKSKKNKLLRRARVERRLHTHKPLYKPRNLILQPLAIIQTLTTQSI